MQNRPYPDLERDWKLLDEAGFHTMWVADHLMTFPTVGSLLEAWTTLGAAAAVTTNIRIGTLVTNITYRNPALLAKEALTIDHISSGRLELGIGAAGTRRDDARVAGVDEWSVSERADRFEEFVEMLDAILRGTEAVDGKHYGTEGFDRGPWMVQEPRPPLTIAAQGPRTLRVAGRFADTWNALAGFGRVGDELISFLKTCNAQLDELAVEFGRRPSDIRRSLLVQNSGFEWWTSPDAFSDFLGTMGDAGVQDFVFYFPPSNGSPVPVDPETFLQLISGVTHA